MGHEDFGIPDKQNAENKAAWDALRGRGNRLDYDRARFLNEVLVENLHNEVPTLAKYMVAELGEFPGKRVVSFLRMVAALDANDDAETWEKLGGKAMVLYARVDGRKRSRLIRKVNATIKRTGRSCVSENTFRTILKDVLGDGYSAILNERRTDGTADYRAQCVVYQQTILDLLTKGTIRRSDLPLKVRTLLGLAPRRSAAA